MQINDIQQFAEGIGMTFFGALLLGFSVWMLPSERKLGAMQQCSGHGYSTMPDKKRSVCMPVISIVMIILGIFQIVTQL